MSKIVIAPQVGGPEVMQIVDRDPGRPGPGEIRMRQTAMGVNFGDIHKRRGTAPPHAMAELVFPLTPGLEAAGVVEEVGAGVTDLRPGDRVAYAVASMIGGYAEARLLRAELAVRLPDGVDDLDVAAILYKGITAHGLLHTCYQVLPGQTVLVHAAAGGVGSILARWATGLGAVAIGTVGTASKAELARQNGCKHVIVLADEDFVARTLELTGGRGADVVYDGVGAAVFFKSLSALKKYGMMLSFGHSSGMVAPLDPVELQHRGLYLTRFSGSTYNADISDYRVRAEAVLAALASGILRNNMRSVYKLDDVVKAHRDIEERRTTGPVVLVP